jgi:putative phage-type endonuclease
MTGCDILHLPDCVPIAAYADITHDEWLRLRLEGLGGSDAGAIMGLSNYGTALTVVLEKTKRLPPQDMEDNEPVEVGNILEPLIRREIVGPYIDKKLGVHAVVIDPTHMYRGTRYPWMIVNVDGFLMFPDELAGLEIKTGSSYMLKYWGGKDGNEVPDSYYAQVQHYMAGTGLSKWIVFGLIGNQRILRIVPRSERFIEKLVAEERRIWEIIERNDPLYFPLPSGTETEYEALLSIGTPQEETTADLQDLTSHLDRYLDLKNEIDDREGERGRLKAEIILSLGRSKYGETERHKVTLSRYESKSFDKARFSREHPDMVEDYTIRSETGRLYVKAK